MEMYEKGDYDDALLGRSNGKGAKKVTKAMWISLFAFTSGLDWAFLALAVTLAVVSGVIIPALSIFLGKLFDAFTDFGLGKLDGSELVHRISNFALGLVVLGCFSGVLNASFFASWLVFGELQAKHARSRLFAKTLEKDISWFDSSSSTHDVTVGRFESWVPSSLIYNFAVDETADVLESFNWLRLSHSALQPNTRPPCLRPSASLFTIRGHSP